jgi:predicted nuclease of predicted toxin-antitoxin system
MRLLLDENLPADLAAMLPEHEVLTVPLLKWSGIKNGELLRRAATVCDVFITMDRNLPFQQNVGSLQVGIVVVRANSNRIADLVPHVNSIHSAVNRVVSGTIEYAGLEESA